MALSLQMMWPQQIANTVSGTYSKILTLIFSPKVNLRLDDIVILIWMTVCQGQIGQNENLFNAMRIWYNQPHIRGLVTALRWCSMRIPQSEHRCINLRMTRGLSHARSYC